MSGADQDVRTADASKTRRVSRTQTVQHAFAAGVARRPLRRPCSSRPRVAGAGRAVLNLVAGLAPLAGSLKGAERGSSHSLDTNGPSIELASRSTDELNSTAD
jgi:hypothetical protein